MNQRRGYMLLEVLTAWVIGTALTGIAVGLLYTLMQIEQTTREQLRHSSSLGRLADQFRRDAHAAVEPIKPQSGSAAPEKPAWQFRFPDGRVAEYRLHGDRFVRSELADGKRITRQSFRLPPRTAVSIGLSADGRPTVVSLRITPQDRRPGEPRARAVTIDAVLAMDHRFVAPKEP